MKRNNDNNDNDNNNDNEAIEVDDQIEANKLIEQGKAVKLDLPKLEEFEKAASDVYDEYIAKMKQIKQSNNPIYTDEVKAYELARLKQEYEQKSAAIEAEYQEYRKKAIEDAKVRAARATVKITEADKLTAKRFANRAILSLASAADKSAALRQIAEDISLLTDEQKTALQSEIVRVLEQVGDDYYTDKQAVISAVQDVRNPDLLAYEVAKQLPHTVLSKQRQRAIIEQVINEPSALTGGGIDKEFYEEYIKGANK